MPPDSTRAPETDIQPTDLNRHEALSQLYDALPLDPSKNEIRVLRLLSGEAGSELECELATVNLEPYTSLASEDDDVWQQRYVAYAEQGVEPYEALSYTWSSTAPADMCDICVNGRQGFSVTGNLFAALQRLRLSARSGELRKSSRCRTLWVDAICINQHDTSERRHQVQLMGLIYYSASVVLMWLGDGESASQEPAQFTDLEHSAGRVAVSPRVWWKRIVSYWLGSSEAPTSCQTGPSDMLSDIVKSSEPRVGDDLTALIAAVRHTRPHWWERVWVAQEFVLARSPPKFCFGTHELQSQSVEDLLRSAGVRSMENVADLSEEVRSLLNGLDASFETFKLKRD